MPKQTSTSLHRGFMKNILNTHQDIRDISDDLWQLWLSVADMMKGLDLPCQVNLMVWGVRAEGSTEILRVWTY